MPRRETRYDIERALADQCKKRLFARDEIARMQARMEQDLERLRKSLDSAEFSRISAQFRKAFHKFRIEVRNRRRRPGEGSMPALVEPPRGPRPFAGGAAAPLELD